MVIKQISEKRNLKLRLRNAYNRKKNAFGVGFKICYIKKCFFLYKNYIIYILFLIFAAKFVNPRKK